MSMQDPVNAFAPCFREPVTFLYHAVLLHFDVTVKGSMSEY